MSFNGSNTRRWTRASCCTAVAVFYQQHSRWPTSAEYRHPTRVTPRIPSSTVIWSWWANTAQCHAEARTLLKSP